MQVPMITFENGETYYTLFKFYNCYRWVLSFIFCSQNCSTQKLKIKLTPWHLKLDLHYNISCQHGKDNKAINILLHVEILDKSFSHEIWRCGRKGETKSGSIIKIPVQGTLLIIYNK